MTDNAVPQAGMNSQREIDGDNADDTRGHLQKQHLAKFLLPATTTTAVEHTSQINEIIDGARLTRSGGWWTTLRTTSAKPPTRHVQNESTAANHPPVPCLRVSDRACMQENEQSIFPSAPSSALDTAVSGPRHGSLGRRADNRRRRYRRVRAPPAVHDHDDAPYPPQPHTHTATTPHHNHY